MKILTYDHRSALSLNEVCMSKIFPVESLLKCKLVTVKVKNIFGIGRIDYAVIKKELIGKGKIYSMIIILIVTPYC